MRHEVLFSAERHAGASSCRKRALLQYLHATRQRLLRLHVLAQWGNMAPAAAAVSRVLDAASRQAAAARDAADQLAMAHAHITAVQVGRAASSASGARTAQPSKAHLHVNGGPA